MMKKIAVGLISVAVLSGVLLFTACNKKHSNSNSDSGGGQLPAPQVPVSTFTLTVDKLGDGAGTVTSQNPGINCGSDCSETYTASATVTLHAVPSDAQNIFSGWTGDCSGTADCILTINANKTAHANFVKDQRLLTVAKTGAGAGTITSTPAGIACGADCNELYAINANITLTAAPDGPASEFLGWSGACSGTGNCAVTMDQIKNVSANFGQVKKTLTVTTSGDGVGTVTSLPPGISCGLDCTEDFLYGTAVQLNPVPADSFSALDHWSGACTGAGSCQFSMNQTRSVDANFKKVSLDGTWTGTTSQGKPMLLMVTNNAITTSSAAYTIPGIYCTVSGHTTITYGSAGLAIDANHHFSDTGTSISYSGTFLSPTSSNGTFHFSNSSCAGSVDVTWSASPSGTVSAISALGMTGGGGRNEVNTIDEVIKNSTN